MTSEWRLVEVELVASENVCLVGSNVLELSGTGLPASKVVDRAASLTMRKSRLVSQEVNHGFS